ncbi:MAG: heme o synthase [Bacteroidota bacterium]|nr:heme o synthase [Bacteroidota bacterium]
MIANKTYTTLPVAAVISSKLQDYKQLVKFRLNMMVVLSTFFGYLLGTEGAVDWGQLCILLLGGFLTVGAANGINQIIERNSDKLMRRTENRPLAQNRMGVPEAIAATMVMGIIGVMLITTCLNQLSGILSLISLCLYGFLYTPLKKISPISVHVGALPGALPPIIGYVAASGSLDTMGWLLFALQFVWQLPHFYSIAWLLDDDYKSVGFKMLPIGTQKDRSAAFQILIYTALLIPLSFLPAYLGLTSWYAGMALGLCSAYFLFQSLLLYKNVDNKAAKTLMFGSFLYLPLMFIILLTDRILWSW